jgi:hypothetical protein
MPELLFDRVITKRQLSVKSATKVGPNDMEMMALPELVRKQNEMPTTAEAVRRRRK